MSSCSILKRSEAIGTSLEMLLYKMVDKIEKQKKNQYDHTTGMRTEINRLPKVLLNYKPQNRRDRLRKRARQES